MEIFSGQHFSFSSFLPIETLRKWEDFGDDPLHQTHQWIPFSTETVLNSLAHSK